MTSPLDSSAEPAANAALHSDDPSVRENFDWRTVPSRLRNAIVVIVDRFSAAYMGSYGNTWLETPELNRIASQSLLFEFATTNSPKLQDVYHAYWWGVTPGLRPESSHSDRDAITGGEAPPGTSLPEVIRRSGVFTCLVTDELRVADMAPEEAFDQRVVLKGQPAAGESEESDGDDIFQTQVAQGFAAALEVAETLPRPFLLWIHLRGMEGPWDAPYSLRLGLAEEDDPEPPRFVDPPRRVLSPDEDPDTRWGYMRAYGGQILALDACCGLFFDALQNLDGQAETLVTWTSPRGYPLGDHQEIGTSLRGLYGDTLHVPWWISLPDGSAAAARCTSLIHPPDMASTLVDWWQLDAVSPSELTRLGNSLLAFAEGLEDSRRPYVVAADEGMLSVRSDAWLAVRCLGESWRIYAKPDDRFEANEVSGRCRPIVETLDSWIGSYVEAASEHFTSLPRLPELLARDDAWI